MLEELSRAAREEILREAGGAAARRSTRPPAETRKPPEPVAEAVARPDGPAATQKPGLWLTAGRRAWEPPAETPVRPTRRRPWRR